MEVFAVDEKASLSRRERQIMHIVYEKGEATVNDVLAAMKDPPSRTAVRTLMRILDEKGHLRHRERGKEYLYRPVRAKRVAGRSALRELLGTFFGGSLGDAVAAHLADPNAELDPDELGRLSRLIDEARERGGES